MTKPLGVRDRLVRSAIGLLRSRGADGFGMTELLDDSGVARRSMYQHFPQGKAQLLEAAAREAGRHIGAQIEASLAQLPPVEALAAWAQVWKQLLIDTDYALGCPLAAAGLAATDYPAADAAAAEAFTGLRRQIAAAFGADGMAPDEADRTASVLLSGMEGAIITARSLRSVQPLDDLVAHARHFLA